MCLLYFLTVCYKMAEEDVEQSCPTTSEEESKTEEIELTEEERKKRIDVGNDLKGKGNEKFKSGGDCTIDTLIIIIIIILFYNRRCCASKNCSFSCRS